MSIVLKFGGSSVSKKGFNKISEQIKLNKNKKIVIVLSALFETTNSLLGIINNKEDNFQNIKDTHLEFINKLQLDDSILSELFDELYNNIKQNKTQYILSFGEKLSTKILFEFLKKSNNVTLVNGSDIIKTNNLIHDMNNKFHMKGEFYCDNYIFDILNNNNIIITQGFIAKTKDNEICTLTRGGSDTTAALIAVKLNSERLEIWTDVNGIYNADPNIIPKAKIINEIDYDLCQEMAGMGAKVLHPYCILPCQKANIPIYIKNTYGENINNTMISNKIKNKLSLILQKNNIVFEVTSLDMWNNYGFVADIFSIFKKHSIDINIITTSQYSVSVTTIENSKDSLNSLRNDLSQNYEVKMFNCDLISVIGRNILQSKNVPKLFQNLNNHDKILITHFSSNNMCLTFAVENSYSLSMYKMLYNLLLDKKIDNENIENKWWYKNSKDLIDLGSKDPIYLYDINTINSKCKILKDELSCINNFYYAIKANKNLNVLKAINSNGFGFECVSIDEVEYIKRYFPDSNVLFTPNYCNILEYKNAFSYNCDVIVDNLEIILNNKDIFYEKEIALRLDLNMGEGHNTKVITEGHNSKFGLPVNDIPKFLKICKDYKVKVIGLHSHRGSDINNISNWYNTFKVLNNLLIQEFNDIKWIDLGGGFGTQLKSDDFIKLNQLISKKKIRDISLRIEPGRFIVSEAGILLCKINQIREKENKKIIGLSTGMNSLLRPALYDAYHQIYNLSKINNNYNEIYDIVGPICESGDILGEKRSFPLSEENDIILIENAGAYGYVMSNSYNMRKPAREEIFNKKILDTVTYNKNDQYFIHL